jgi:hypothetical protein
LKVSLLRPWNSGGRLKLYEAEHLRHSTPRLVLLAPRETLSGARRAQAWVSGARSATALAHPYLLRLAAAGTTDDGGAYAAYPMMPHRTARHLLEQSGPLDVERACDVAGCVLSALQLAHASGFMHGAVSIDTVLLAPNADVDPPVLLLGLGPCAALEALPNPICAPERLAGAPLTERGDVYSVAVLIVSLLAPKASNTAREWVVGADIPDALKDTLLSALAPDPLSRQQTARALASELLGFASNPGLFLLRLGLPPLLEEPKGRVAIYPNTIVRSERAGYAASEEPARERLRAAIVPSAPTLPQLMVPRGQGSRPKQLGAAGDPTAGAAPDNEQAAAPPGSDVLSCESDSEMPTVLTRARPWLSPQLAAFITAAGFGAGLWIAWLSGLI